MRCSLARRFCSALSPVSLRPLRPLHDLSMTSLCGERPLTFCSVLSPPWRVQPGETPLQDCSAPGRRGAYNPAKLHSKIAQRRAGGARTTRRNSTPRLLSAGPEALSPQSSARGRLNQKRVLPGALSTPVLPPWASRISFTMASPIPVPPKSLERDFSAR